MKCTICGTTEKVRKFKHLPLSNGRNGYITLSDWTVYCATCAKQQADFYTKQMDLLRSRQ